MSGQLGDANDYIPQWEGSNIKGKWSVVEVPLPQGPGKGGREGSGSISIMPDDGHGPLMAGDISDLVRNPWDKLHHGECLS